VRGFLDSQNSIEKKEELVKRLSESLNPIVKGIPTKRPETTTICGLNPIVKRDSHRKGLRQQWVVA
jgi:hypothetical protein